MADAEPPAYDAVTFHPHISRISHERCSSCHRSSLVAPLPLLIYEDAAKRAQPVRVATRTGWALRWYVSWATIG